MRRLMLAFYPGELNEMRASQADVLIKRRAFPERYNDLYVLLIACADPKTIPVHILADDDFVHLVKTVKSGALFRLGSTLGLIALGSNS